MRPAPTIHDLEPGDYILTKHTPNFRADVNFSAPCQHQSEPDQNDEVDKDLVVKHTTERWCVSQVKNITADSEKIMVERYTFDSQVRWIAPPEGMEAYFSYSSTRRYSDARRVIASMTEEEATATIKTMRRLDSFVPILHSILDAHDAVWNAARSGDVPRIENIGDEHDKMINKIADDALIFATKIRLFL